VLSSVWSRPGLWATEIAWRWLYGIPALTLTLYELRGVLLQATRGTMDPGSLGLTPTLLADPVGSLSADPLLAAGLLAHAWALLLPGLLHVGASLVPLLFVLWAAASGFGRTALLKRAEPSLSARPFAVMALNALRALALAVVFRLWFGAVAWASRTAITEPVAAHTEPNLVLYCAMVIVISLGLYTAWGFAGWLFSVAPVLAMARNLGALASLRAAWGLGPLRGKLVEINLVLAIVKIALLVLLMVFTATPLPFESVATPEFLFWWWIAMMTLYIVWSDFFHVARLVGYLALYREFTSHEPSPLP
jgi:hypothetical protein